MQPITHRELKLLAERYSTDSGILLNARRWSSAYYLAGYAVECGLKARIAKSIKARQFPDRVLIEKFYRHDLVLLVGAAELTSELQVRKSEQGKFRRNGDQVATKWRSEARYLSVSRAIAEEMVHAVNDPREGVLPWLRSLW